VTEEGIRARMRAGSFSRLAAEGGMLFLASPHQIPD